MKKSIKIEQVNAGVLAAVENKNYDYFICKTPLDYLYMWYVQHVGCDTYVKKGSLGSFGTGEVEFSTIWKPDTSWYSWHDSIKRLRNDIKDAMGINLTVKETENLMIKAIEIAHPNITFIYYDHDLNSFKVPVFGHRPLN